MTRNPTAWTSPNFTCANDAETSLAVRDEIVALVLENAGISRGDAIEAMAVAVTGMSRPGENAIEEGGAAESPTASSSRRRRRKPVGGANPEVVLPPATDAPETNDPFYLPQVGVEILASENRNGVNYYVVSDLRNGRG